MIEAVLVPVPTGVNLTLTVQLDPGATGIEIPQVPRPPETSATPLLGLDSLQFGLIRLTYRVALPSATLDYLLEHCFTYGEAIAKFGILYDL